MLLLHRWLARSRIHGGAGQGRSLRSEGPLRNSGPCWADARSWKQGGHALWPDGPGAAARGRGHGRHTRTGRAQSESEPTLSRHRKQGKRQARGRAPGGGGGGGGGRCAPPIQAIAVPDRRPPRAPWAKGHRTPSPGRCGAGHPSSRCPGLSTFRPALEPPLRARGMGTMGQRGTRLDGLGSAGAWAEGPCPEGLRAAPGAPVGLPFSPSGLVATDDFRSPWSGAGAPSRGQPLLGSALKPLGPVRPGASDPPLPL